MLLTEYCIRLPLGRTVILVAGCPMCQHCHCDPAEHLLEIPVLFGKYSINLCSTCYWFYTLQPQQVSDWEFQYEKEMAILG